MQSWILESFIEAYSVTSVSDIWGITRQAINQARNDKRDIQIIRVDDYFEVVESKLLKKIPCSDIRLMSSGPDSRKFGAQQ